MAEPMPATLSTAHCTFSERSWLEGSNWMGKIANGDGGALPDETKGTSYTRYIERQFTLTAHRCNTGGRCRMLGCGRSYMWQAGQVPPLESVDTLLSEWIAFRNKPSKLARGRQTNESDASTKRKAVESAFPDSVRLIKPFRDITILCDWEPAQTSNLFRQVSQYLGSTVLNNQNAPFFDSGHVLDFGPEAIFSAD
jgi:hypothetical protein